MSAARPAYRVGSFAFALAVCLLSCEIRAAGPTTAPVIKPIEPVTGNLMRYQLGEGGKDWPADKRERIVESMDWAVGLYNQLGQFPKNVTAWYSPSTPTADGNYNGAIRFGGQIGRRVALHELGHVVGIGTHGRWKDFVTDGKWTGEHALAQLRAFDGTEAILHCDQMHFWPYGLNQDREGSPENFRRHVLMVAALRRDMGIVTGEPFKGMIGLGTWATSAEFKGLKVSTNKKDLFAGKLGDNGWRKVGGNWEAAGGVFRQSDVSAKPALALVGDADWGDYTITVKARKTGGSEGFLLAFGAKPDGPKSWWNIGGYHNTVSCVEAPDTVAESTPTVVENSRWYDLRVELTGSTVKCYLDGKLVNEGNR